MKFTTLSEEEFTNYTKNTSNVTQSIELYNYRNKINYEALILWG